MSQHRIQEGDCIAGMKDEEAGSADLVFADPPFNIGFDYDIYEDKKSLDEYLSWSKAWMQEAHRVLHPHGSFWIAIGPEYVSELDVTAKSLGFHKRNVVIWTYTFGVNCQNNFTRATTHLLYYTKHRTKFTFNVDQVRVPSARQVIYRDKRQNPKGRLPDNMWILRPQDAPEFFQETDQVWHCPRINGTFKARQKLVACQMPEQVMGRIIRLCSHPGDLVVDPFAGSGATTRVAKKLGRKSLAWELSPSYRAAAQARVDEAKEGDPLDTPAIQGG